MMANEQQKQKLKILFHSLDSTGHINACIGIGQTLIERGHQCYFIITNEKYIGNFSKFGFKELLLLINNVDDDDQKTTEEQNVEPKTSSSNHPNANDEKLINELNTSGILSARSSLEKLDLYDRHKNKDYYAKQLTIDLIKWNSQIAKMIDVEKPDLIIVDHMLVVPCIAYGKIPWSFLWSANPIPLYRFSKKLPPPFSGLFVLLLLILFKF